MHLQRSTRDGMNFFRVIVYSSLSSPSLFLRPSRVYNRLPRLPPSKTLPCSPSPPAANSKLLFSTNWPSSFCQSKTWNGLIRVEEASRRSVVEPGAWIVSIETTREVCKDMSRTLPLVGMVWWCVNVVRGSEVRMNTISAGMLVEMLVFYSVRGHISGTNPSHVTISRSITPSPRPGTCVCKIPDTAILISSDPVTAAT